MMCIVIGRIKWGGVLMSSRREAEGHKIIYSNKCAVNDAHTLDSSAGNTNRVKMLSIAANSGFRKSVRL